MQSERAKQEVNALEQNAARGVRDVGMLWALRRFFVPLLGFLLICSVAAYVQTGFWAAVPALALAIVFAVLVLKLYQRHFLKGAPVPGRNVVDRMLDRNKPS